MAAASPVPNNISNDIGINSPTSTANSATPPRRPPVSDTPRQNLRGLNKPKCSKCGNVARSRCPYQSCKSCCAKAQNPCHIHVLKSSTTLPDKPPSAISSSLDQPSTDASPSGNSLRISSLRQIPNNYAKFIGSQSSLRSRRPLSRKDAATINSWRFSKLKEYIDRNLEAESEAFDRYIQNVNLLEEAFSLNSATEALSVGNEVGSQDVVAGSKVKLQASTDRAESCRQRIKELVDQGLAKLQKAENDVEKMPDADDPDAQKESKRPKKAAAAWWHKQASSMSELNDKLNKARTEDDLKACLEMKYQLFSPNLESGSLTGKSGTIEGVNAHTTDEHHSEIVSSTGQEISSHMLPPKLFRTVEIDQEGLSEIELQCSSLNQIAEL